MITYAERECFHPSHLALLARVQEIVARVSDTWGNELRCHELARAVHRVIGDSSSSAWRCRRSSSAWRGRMAIAVVDGHCGMIEHSWLRCGDGVILDPYAPGRLPAVQLVDPLAGSYRLGVKRRDVRRSVIKRLVLEMRSSVRCTPKSSVAPAR